MPDKLKGLTSFELNLPEINNLTDFVAEPPKKKSIKKEVYVRRKTNGRDLF